MLAKRKKGRKIGVPGRGACETRRGSEGHAGRETGGSETRRGTSHAWRGERHGGPGKRRGTHYFKSIS